MKYDEIIKLLDAGYSREEILNMKEEDIKQHYKRPSIQTTSSYFTIYLVNPAIPIAAGPPWVVITPFALTH